MNQILYLLDDNIKQVSKYLHTSIVLILCILLLLEIHPLLINLMSATTAKGLIEFVNPYKLPKFVK